MSTKARTTSTRAPRSPKSNATLPRAILDRHGRLVTRPEVLDERAQRSSNEPPGQATDLVVHSSLRSPSRPEFRCGPPVPSSDACWAPAGCVASCSRTRACASASRRANARRSSGPAVQCVRPASTTSSILGSRESGSILTNFSRRRSRACCSCRNRIGRAWIRRASCSRRLRMARSAWSRSAQSPTLRLGGHRPCSLRSLFLPPPPVLFTLMVSQSLEIRVVTGTADLTLPTFLVGFRSLRRSTCWSIHFSSSVLRRSLVMGTSCGDRCRRLPLRCAPARRFGDHPAATLTELRAG